MDCSSCHVAIPEGAKFCPSCGKELQLELRPACANCGQTLGPGQQYCTVCGTPVAPSAGPAPAFVVAPPPQIDADPQYPASYPYPAGAVSTPERPAGEGRPASPAPPAEKPAGKGRPVGFWIPFTMFLPLSIFFFWAGNTSLQGWAVLIVSYVVLFASRKRISSTGILTGFLVWIVLLIVLFFVMIATSSPRIG